MCGGGVHGSGLYGSICIVGVCTVGGLYGGRLAIVRHKIFNKSDTGRETNLLSSIYMPDIQLQQRIHEQEIKDQPKVNCQNFSACNNRFFQILYLKLD